MASISVRSGPPGSPTHPAQSLSRRRNGLHDVDLNTFIAEEMALHLDSTTNRKRGPAPCSDVITDSPTHKRNRMLWTYLHHWSLFCLLLSGQLDSWWGLMPWPTTEIFLSCNATNKENCSQPTYLAPSLLPPHLFFAGYLVLSQTSSVVVLFLFSRFTSLFVSPLSVWYRGEHTLHLKFSTYRMLLRWFFFFGRAPLCFTFSDQMDQAVAYSLWFSSPFFFKHTFSSFECRPNQTELKSRLLGRPNCLPAVWLDSDSFQRVHLILLLCVFAYLTAELPLSVVLVFAFEKAATVSLVFVQQWVCVCVCLWMQGSGKSSIHLTTSS